MTTNGKSMKATCRECGCSDDRACVRLNDGGVFDPEVEACHWVEPDLCSACSADAPAEGWVHPPPEGERDDEYERALAGGTVIR